MPRTHGLGLGVYPFPLSGGGGGGGSDTLSLEPAQVATNQSATPNSLISTGTAVEWGDNGANLNHLGIRFTNVEIAQSESIYVARLKIQTESDANNSLFAQPIIYGHDVDDSAAFANSDTPTNRVNGGALTSATVQNRFDANLTKILVVTDIVQEIVDRAGWSSGNALSFLLQIGASASDIRLRADLEDTTKYELEIIKSEPSSSENYAQTNATQIAATDGGNASSCYLNNGDAPAGPFFGSSAGAYEFTIGGTFENVNILQGATISSATLRLVCGSQALGSGFNARGRAWDVDHHPGWQFADSPNNVDNDNEFTTAASSFNAVTANTTQSWDVTTVIQEIVNRSGWRYGNSIGMIAHPVGGGNNRLNMDIDTLSNMTLEIDVA